MTLTPARRAARELVARLPIPALDPFRANLARAHSTASGERQAAADLEFEVEVADGTWSGGLLRTVLLGFGRAGLVDDLVVIWEGVSAQGAHHGPGQLVRPPAARDGEDGGVRCRGEAGVGATSAASEGVAPDDALATTLLDAFIDACIEARHPALALEAFHSLRPARAERGAFAFPLSPNDCGATGGRGDRQREGLDMGETREGGDAMRTAVDWVDGAGSGAGEGRGVADAGWSGVLRASTYLKLLNCQVRHLWREGG